MTKAKKKKRRKRCEGCNELCYDVAKGWEPYALEIHGREIAVWYCTNCYNKALQDI